MGLHHYEIILERKCKFRTLRGVMSSLWDSRTHISASVAQATPHVHNDRHTVIALYSEEDAGQGNDIIHINLHVFCRDILGRISVH